MSRTKTKTKAAPAAQTLAEADVAVARIGIILRELKRQEADLGDKIADLKARAEAAADPWKSELLDLEGRVQRFCEANRDDLTRNGRTKTVIFATGEARWRTRPPSVTLRGVDTIIEFLQAQKPLRFLRTKVEINKEAMLADPEKARLVPGVKISSEGEDFVIEPFEAELLATAAAA